MATYTNLASLEGLQVGDIVTYTSTTAFDAKGYKFQIELYGKKASNNGGLTKFVIDTSILPETILSFNYRGDLIYGNTTSLYYRIAVGGDAGSYGSTGNGTQYITGGAGGGTVGGSSGSNTGGSQTSGGKNSQNSSDAKGGFGQGGDGRWGGVTNFLGGDGGYGWYGGGGANAPSPGAGGSGFIIGVSTTTYPSGYLGDDTTLRQTIASSITEGTLTQGGSEYTLPRMVMTILEVPSSGESLSTLKYFNGTDFIDTNAKYYNGSELINCDVYYFDGTELKKI